MAPFLKLVEWKDDSRNTLVYRFPCDGKQIYHKSKLTVRESQLAIFVYKGQIADIFEPGYYSLDTHILPILSKLAGIAYGFKTPLTVEIYFINTKQFTDNKWGTINPIMMRDPEFGVVRVRGFGKYSFRVNNPEAFLKELFGTNSSFETEDIADYLKTIVVSGITDAIGESKLSALDLAGNTLEFNEIVKGTVQNKFNEMGLELTNLFIENMSMPPEVEAALDERSKLGILGDKTDVMMKIAAAESMKEAAKNPGMGGSMMGAGLGLGAGAGLGQMFAGAFAQAQNQTQNQQPVATPSESKTTCPSCGASVKSGAKFCPECGEKFAVKVACPHCGAEVSSKSKFCPECGKSLTESNCPSCGAKVKAGAKFCPECGEKL